jgi:hypothetical protein
MTKKNPYLFTIGFNAKDPNHVQVANLLNEQGKGNIASFLVRAVLSYQVSGQQYVDPALLESIVNQIVAKQLTPHTSLPIEADETSCYPSLRKSDKDNILRGLTGFRKK